MFNFFCNLAFSLYLGSWISIPNNDIVSVFISYMKQVPIFGMFNNSTEAFYNSITIGSYVYTTYQIPALAVVIAVILSTICCIGVFWLIIRSIMRLFQFLTFER